MYKAPSCLPCVLRRALWPGLHCLCLPVLPGFKPGAQHVKVIVQPGLQMLETAGMPADDMKEGSWANRASQVLQQPLQDDSRQHSWTAGRPSPKYRPPSNAPSHISPGATPTPHTGLQTLSEEDSTYTQTPSEQANDQPALFSYRPLAAATHAQAGHQQPATTTDANLMSPVAGASPPPHQQPTRSPLLTAEAQAQGLVLRDSPRPVSPFETAADMPFTPPQRVQSILSSHHTDRVHFEENPLFVPVESPDGAGYRWELFYLLP